MDYLQTFREASGKALEGMARALYEKSVSEFESAIVELTRGGTPADYEKAAEILTVVPLKVRGADNTYADARFGSLVNEVYFNMFLRACEDKGCTAEEYMPLLFAAQYAKSGSALNGLDKCVDRYVERLARVDFDGAAEYIDRFDGKLGKYAVLLAVDKDRALSRLLDMALYKKHVDRAAVRDILMDYDEVADRLTARYGKASAHERVAIVRLLCAFKANGKVRMFLNEVVACDKSKSVRDAAGSGMRKQKASTASAFFETLMAEGRALSLSEWREKLSDAQYAAVADRIFFGTAADDLRVHVLVYNAGKFLDSADRPIASNADVRIFVLHPLDIPDENSELCALNITQPFLQLKRPVYHAIEGERYSSSRLIGTMTVRDDFLRNLKKFGFEICAKRSEREPDTAACRVGEYVVGVECDASASTDSVSCGKLAFYRASDVVKLKRKLYIPSSERLDMRLIPARAYSELVYKACLLFGEA